MLVIYLGIVLCIFFTIIAIKSEKKILNPVTVFCGIWAFIIYLSSKHLYTLYEVKIITYKWIIMGNVFFVFGYYGWKLITRGKFIYIKWNKLHKDSKHNEYVLRYNYIYILSIICIIFLIKDIMNLEIHTLKYGVNLKNIQMLVRECENIHSSLENAIRFLIISPFCTAISVITAIDFCIGKKDKRLFGLTIIILICKVLSTGGREAFIKFFFYLIIGYSFASNKIFFIKSFELKKINRRSKRNACLVFVLGIIFLAMLSFSRAGNNILKTIYLDFAMQPNMLEYWSDVVESRNLFGYGFASLNGFFYPILYIAKNLIRLFPDMPVLYEQIYNITMLTDSQWIRIGSELTANAYVSVFWFLYYDAREFGIAIGMFIYGIFSFNMYNLAIRKTCERNVCKYALILVGLFYTFGRMEFTITSYVLAYFFICFGAYKNCLK
ncbi:O-antigen polymerase [Clostridium botulinum]|uniref:O-antigen polymerase n=1 Tax=Clostridium botulinum TaxID=1491 RepID=UPI001C9B9EF8|nr:O-antigen polymerase [Clostridium botulinum]MBY6811418.1 oligosaccharide repeat unit polymerase [Clostridium botulinum]MBY6824831.1 oligosaccharide repeat unit polymerase [Clostridium botulinum]MBY6835231.1 oligosaccharide repeat unit polymerase [Clostridium botulinum]MBY6973744.1 oligosaccharide repeat unit polymerase [Clostridium botulinum]HBJ1651641.1 oligosaccharide repeat unit polymerase [Clostridium botulinum]